MLYQNENFGGKLEFRTGWHDGFIVPMHLHEYSEFLYVYTGCAEVCVAGRELCIPAGHLIFIQPNQLHEYRCRSAQVRCAVFSNDLIPLVIQQLAGRSLVPAAVPMERGAEWIDALAGTDTADAVRLSGYLNLICAHALEHAQYEQSEPSDSVLYHKVLNHLSVHFAEDLTLGGLARQFGYNEKYLSHSLHSVTGMNFRRLLCSYRVEHAMRLLAESPEMSIAQIAMRSGFTALNTFNRVFREQTGQKPGEYRKSMRRK